VTNIRLLAGSETSPLAGAIPRGITRAPRTDEDLLAGWILSGRNARREMRAVLFVSNYWQWSGSFAQYVRWITGETIPDPDRPSMARGDCAVLCSSPRDFTTSRGQRTLSRLYSHLIQRRNTVNGRLYRDDPAVMTWELATNLARAPMTRTLRSQRSANGLTTRQFIHARIRTPRLHGSEGIWGCLKKPELFVKRMKPGH